MNIDRLENETDFEWEVRLCKAKLDKEIDLDWSEIVEMLNLDIHPDSLRKMAYGYRKYDNYIDAKKNLNITDDNYLAEIRNCKYELQKEHQKLCDERAALNKILREDARGERNWDLLEALIRENGKNTLPLITTDNKESKNNDLIICLSDLHLGLNVENNFGKFNVDIASDRLSSYLKEIFDLKEIYGAKNAHLLLLGDIVSGAIHVTTRLENRENAIEQSQIASEIISSFIYMLSGKFETVTVSSVAGNHSRIGLKNDVLRDERLDNIITWYAKAKLSHINNIIFNDDNYDCTLGKLTIYGKKYFICHGDFDTFSESGVSKLVMMTGEIPEAIFMGHLHHCSYDDISNIKIIRSGSLCGAIDDYSVSKRLSGKPCQMVCVADENGIKSIVPINL